MSHLSHAYTCLVSGLGLQSATVNYPSHVIVELSDSSGKPCSLEQNVTAELVLQSTSSQAEPQFPDASVSATVAVMYPSRYEVSYTAVRRGPHELHVHVNTNEINGSPFTVIVYPDPTQIGSPVRIMKDLRSPYGIALSSCREMIVTHWEGGEKVSVFDVEGKMLFSFGRRGTNPDQMKAPAGVAIDDFGSIYVASEHKMQKFTSSGELIKCIGQEGSEVGEFKDPRGVAVHKNEVYICDRGNHRIQVFDLDLNLVRSFGSRGYGEGVFTSPIQTAFDTAGNLYVAEFMSGGNQRVQVMDTEGHYIRSIGCEGDVKLKQPSAIVIADNFMYVSEIGKSCILVFDTCGKFITKFGKFGSEGGQFSCISDIISCPSGFIYVCEEGNNRVQVF